MPLLTIDRSAAGDADAVLDFVRQPQQFLLDLALAEGPIAQFSMNGRPYALVSDPDDVHGVLSGDGDSYAKGALYEIPRVFGGDGVFTAEGDDWMAQRAAIHSFFSRSRVQALNGLIATAGARLLARWEEHDDVAVDVMAAAKRAAFDVVSVGLLGIPAGLLADELFDALSDVDRVEHVTVWLLAERFGRAAEPAGQPFGPSAVTWALSRIDRLL
jgi:cytochrome P450